jgi:hypothetical protein
MPNYELEQILIIEKIDAIVELEQAVINKINAISTRVGAPTYSKTPIFKKKRRENYVSNKDWEALRNFKETKFEKKEGIELEIVNVKTNLNKLTDKSYDEILQNVTNIIEKNKEDDDLETIGKLIFQIGSANKFWSKLYARLYYDLISKFTFMNDICNKNFDTFKEILLNVRYIDPKDNYDLYCQINKENEERKGLSKFLAICTNKKIILIDNMMEIIYGLFNYIEINLNNIDNKNQIEEIVENLYILLTNLLVSIKEDKNLFDDLHKRITFFTELKISEYEAVSNKFLFKFIDILEEFEE